MDILEKRIGEILVTAEGQVVKEKFELDKTVRLIKGIKLTSDREDLLFYRGVQRVVINGRNATKTTTKAETFNPVSMWI